MNLRMSDEVREKLIYKHQVSVREVEQCFLNRSGGLLQDTRAGHKTEPPTLWFIAPTNQGRLLKVVYIRTAAGVELKTAYAPNPDEIRIYNKYS